ncbi:hypothetical protein Dda_3218 [Drechslerella dactyloides]|uniref:Uncharacterized protein n=1 Tax=Drechslerella dactyloides TaxID=74499 RepID=A0AAD6J3A3_DREDA|nr:hypothetical protein Dda_3218 [Drechslerella dactyloides]
MDRTSAPEKASSAALGYDTSSRTVHTSISLHSSHHQPPPQKRVKEWKGKRTPQRLDVIHDDRPANALRRRGHIVVVYDHQDRKQLGAAADQQRRADGIRLAEAAVVERQGADRGVEDDGFRQAEQQEEDVLDDDRLLV